MGQGERGGSACVVPKKLHGLLCLFLNQTLALISLVLWCKQFHLSASSSCLENGYNQHFPYLLLSETPLATACIPATCLGPSSSPCGCSQHSISSCAQPCRVPAFCSWPYSKHCAGQEWCVTAPQPVEQARAPGSDVEMGSQVPQAGQRGSN